MKNHLQNLSHSMVMTLLDAPWLMMKLFRASTFMPTTHTYIHIDQYSYYHAQIYYNMTVVMLHEERCMCNKAYATSTHAALYGGEAGVEPAFHETLFHEPVQLALRQHRVHEVHLSKGLDVNRPQAQGILLAYTTVSMYNLMYVRCF